IKILREGLGMVDGMLKLLTVSRVGHVGLYRDPETLQPVEYYMKLPSDIAERELIVMDPMLATGGSANDAIYSLKKRGATKIRLLCLVAAPDGVDLVKEHHPDMDIYLGALDNGLNEYGHLLPVTCYSGGRLFGTK